MGWHGDGDGDGDGLAERLNQLRSWTALRLHSMHWAAAAAVRSTSFRLNLLF